MRMTRRQLLIGAGASALGVLLVSCTPEPTPRPTRSPTAPLDTEVPAPAANRRSTWSTDPFSRGAASYLPVGVQPTAREALSQPIQGRVFFAGEATSVDDPGTVRGAIQSGERAALRLRAVASPGERIAVVGAGMAGATVVAELALSDVEVTVFEARERVGGRIHSVLDDSWPFAVQLGSWLQHPDAEARDDSEPDDADADTDTDADVIDLDGTLWRVPAEAAEPARDVEPADGALVEGAVTAARALPADVALADALIETGADPDEPALAALLAALSASTGAEPHALSSWFAPALPAEGLRGDLSDLTPGVDTLLGATQRNLSSPVSRVAYDESGISLRLGTGESMTCDRVVITVPLGVLQEEGIEFDPPLPFAHRGAIHALGMGHIETVWLRYDEPFWDNDAGVWHVVGGDASIRTWLNLAPSSGENVLVGLVGGAAAERFAALDDEGALAAALTSLEAFLPVAATD